MNLIPRLLIGFPHLAIYAVVSRETVGFNELHDIGIILNPMNATADIG
jgi:hypothetical protein